MERTPWTSGTTSSTTSTPPSATLIWRSPPSQKQSGTSTTSTPSSAMLIWRLPLPSSPCPNSELIRTRWRWRQSHRRFRRAYIFDIWAERAFKFWITGVSTAGIPDRKEEAKFSEDNWGASTSILSTNCREDNSRIEGIGIGTVNERNGSFWFLHERA